MVDQSNRTKFLADENKAVRLALLLSFFTSILISWIITNPVNNLEDLKSFGVIFLAAFLISLPILYEVLFYIFHKNKKVVKKRKTPKKRSTKKTSVKKVPAKKKTG